MSIKQNSLTSSVTPSGRYRVITTYANNSIKSPRYYVHYMRNTKTLKYRTTYSLEELLDPARSEGAIIWPSFAFTNQLNEFYDLSKVPNLKGPEEIIGEL